MADEYDGRVVIDTELDTDGFKSGSDKLIDALKGVEAKINSLGSEAAKAFEEPQTMKLQVEAPEPDDIRDELEDAVETAADDLPPVQPHLDSTALEKESGSMQRKLSSITNEIYRMVSASAQGFRTSSAVLAFDNQLMKAQDHIEDARAALQEFAEQQIPTDKYAETTAEIEKTEGQLQKLYDKASQMQHTGVDEQSKAWQNLMAQIEKTDNLLRMYEDEAESLRLSGDAFIDPKATEQYHDMVEELQAAERAFQTNVGLIKQEEIEQARMNVLTAQEKVAQAGNIFARQLALKELEKAQNQLAAIAQKSVTTAPDPKAASGWHRLGERLRSVGQIAKQVGTAAVKGFSIPLKGALKGAKSAVNGIVGLFSKLKGKSGVDGLFQKFTSLKNMLMSRIKRTFISFLFNQITESFKALAQFDSNFDRSVSNMQNRAKELGANIMAAFGGLIQKVEPIITGLIDRASNAVVKINAALAALRGQTTMTVAAERTESYAASLDNAASSAAKAKTAQDKLNQTLTSYDEIHKLTNEHDAEANADAEEAASAPVYKTVQVEPVIGGMDEAVRGLITRLRDAIKRGDWRGAGETIAEGFNFAISKLDDAILKARDKVVRGAHNLAEGLNGFVDKFDAYGAGRAIANGLNVALDVAYEFLHTFDFDRLGQQAAAGLNGLADQFDAYKLGKTISEALNSAIDLAYGFVSELDFSGLGRKVSDLLNGMVDNFDGKKLGETIKRGVNGAIDFAYEALTNFKWDKFGIKIGEAFNKLFGGSSSKISDAATQNVGGAARDAYVKSLTDSAEGIDWGKMAKLLSQGIIGVFRSVGSFIETTDWKAVGEDIMTFLVEIDWDGIAQEMMRLLGDAIGGVAGLVKGALKIGMEKAEGWGEKLFDEYGSEFNEAGEQVTAGIWAGIAAPFRYWWDKVKQNCFDPFVKAFKKVFGISSPAKKMVPYGEYVAEGIFEGIKDIFSSCGDWVRNNIFEPLKAGFDRAFSVVGTTANAVKDKGETIANGIKTGIAKGWSAVTTLLSGKKDDLAKASGELADSAASGFKPETFESAGKNVVTGLSRGITDQKAWDENVGSEVMKRAGWIKNAFNENEFKPAGENVVVGIGDGIKDQPNWDRNVGGPVNERAGWIEQGFRDVDYEGAGRSIVDGLGKGIREGYSISAAIAENLGGVVLDQFNKAMGISSPSKKMAESGVYIVEGLAEGIQSESRKAYRSMQTVAANVLREAEATPQIKLQASTDALDVVADKLASIAEIFQSIKRTFTDMTEIPIPAIVTGNFAPARTSVVESETAGNAEIKMLLRQFMDRAAELEEKLANRPIRVDSHVEIDKREIARATAEVRQDTNNISNGGGRW